MANKPFSQLLPDIIFAGKEVCRRTARDTTWNLQNDSPFWDGYFANEWEMRPGDVDIPADIKGAVPSPEPTPRSGNIVYKDAPQPKREGGRWVVTIGNRMEYRAVAMDIEAGRNAEGNKVNYVPKGWFETYTQGGQMLRVTERATVNVFRALGFGK